MMHLRPIRFSWNALILHYAGALLYPILFEDSKDSADVESPPLMPLLIPPLLMLPPSVYSMHSMHLICIASSMEDAADKQAGFYDDNERLSEDYWQRMRLSAHH